MYVKVLSVTIKLRKQTKTFNLQRGEKKQKQKINPIECGNMEINGKHSKQKINRYQNQI